MIDRLYLEELPDVVCFSVMSWDYQRFQRASEVFRMMNPKGWIIYGGNHVANQAERVFAECPHVDVLVNGEGEFSFADLMRARLAGTKRFLCSSKKWRRDTISRLRCSAPRKAA